MRKFTLGAVAVAGAAALAATALPAAIASAPPARGPAPAAAAPRHDNLPDAKADKRNEVRSIAIKKLVSGKAKAIVKGKSKVVAIGKRADGKTQYAEVASVAPVKTDSIFTILTDFGTKTDPRATATPGPLHNQIAEPNRSEDNTTNWSSDFSRQHFLDMFFKTGTESFADFYSKQSGGSTR